MAIAALIFMLLAIFYYEYVPPGAYDEKPDQVESKDSISDQNKDCIQNSEFVDDTDKEYEANLNEAEDDATEF